MLSAWAFAADGKWPVERTAVFRSVVELPLGGAELDAGSHVCVMFLYLLHLDEADAQFPLKGSRSP